MEGGLFAMQQYDSFKQYFNINYCKAVKEFFELFIPFQWANENSIKPEDVESIFCDILDVQVQDIEFTKSEYNKVELNCYSRIKYDLFYNGERVFKHTKVVYTGGLHFAGNFRKGFQIKKKKDIIIENKPFKQKLTKKLVPVIDNDTKERYASRFLKEFCPKALTTPMALPIKDMLKKAGLEYYFAPLGHGIYGKIYFSDDHSEIYNDNDEIILAPVKRGTILVDKDKYEERGKFTLNNTLIHEMVHWFYHSNFFELRQLLNNELTCAVCFRKDSEYEDDEIKWMESQAKSITPKILMPKKMFIRQYKEFLRINKRIQKDKWFGEVHPFTKEEIPSKVIIDLSHFFNVSKASVKYRLIELGYSEFDGIFNYDNEAKRYYESFFFPKDSLGRHQTFFISKNSYLSIIKTNEVIRNDIESEKLIYSNGLLVINTPEFVTNGKINQFGLKHVDRCCIKINISSEMQCYDKAENNFCLFRGDVVTRTAQIDNDQYIKIISQCTENTEHYNKHRKYMPASVGDTMAYHIKKIYGDDRPHTEDVVRKCDITAKTYRKYLDGNVEDYKFEIIIKFAIGMKLSSPYIDDLLHKANIIVDSGNNARSVLLETTKVYPRIGLVKTYEKLKIIHCESYLHLSKNFIKHIKSDT